jgi:hypothetical protein
VRRLAILPALALLGAAPGVFTDRMDDSGQWPAGASDSVAASARPVAGADGSAVELAYDFDGVSGYAFVRRKADFALPSNFEIRFAMRGRGGRNDLQFKLTDGDNVWWKVWSNRAPPGAWEEIVIPAGELGFAWGPASDHRLRHADGIEIVVARNRDGGTGAIAIDQLRIVPLPGEPVPPAAVEDRANAELMALARSAPRGAYPRAFLGEQPYWTLAGSDGRGIAALIDEDAGIEFEKGGYSIAPVVIDGGRQFDWANVTASQSLADHRLPIPAVRWTAPGFTLDTTLLAEFAGRAAFAAYTLTNRGPAKRPLELRLAIRPWQVNPPSQFLSQKGGASPISSIERVGNMLTIVQPGEDGDPPARRQLIAAKGFQLEGGDLAYRLTLAPGETRRIVLTMPTSATPPSFDSSLAETLAHWRRRLGRVAITVPPDKQAFADTVATAFAHVLTSRDGPMLRPGTRSYDRAWIRDGAMMSEALLRMGRADVARAFADWYGRHLFASGKVPCCVDFRGADPVPENDSQGEYVFLVSELYRFTRDREALERDWPHVLAAARYMDRLRLSERTIANQTPERRMLYGLMPPSISHEGYSAKPQYSLWDDFWALRGYRDAADIAAVLGKPEAAELAASRDQFAGDLNAAILAARDHWHIAYIPGATSIGDFDATSTTVALDPGNEQARLDPAMLRATFERYWTEFGQRSSGAEWKDYTPYETRTIGSFVRLGWRDRIDAPLAFFMAGRRPSGWNQWAEVVGRDPREVRFIGDMPHAWVASDFVRSALDIFAWDRRDDRVLVLGGGLSPGWLEGRGSAIRGVATPYGSLDFAMRGDPRKLIATIAGTARPPGGFVLAWPFDGKPGTALVNGRRASWHEGAIHIPATGRPIRVETIAIKDRE